jgi:hypothetical protein
MPRRILHLLRRKHLIFLAASLVLFGYLALVRNDTTPADLAICGGMVLALWLLTGLRAYLAAGQVRTSPDGGRENAR